MVKIDGVELDNLYAVKRPYNGTVETGGDPLVQDLNVWYNVGARLPFWQTGDIAFVITSTALMLLMIPGIGLFYSGLARRKSALSLMFLSSLALAVTTVQWFVWGYSLSFSRTANGFIGDLSNAGFRNVLARPSVGRERIPDLLFAVYEGMLSALTVALAVGAAAERGRVLPAVIFMFVWATLVYDPIACWTWNPAGWSFRMGGLDYAGGTPVHIASGAAALAYSMMLGPRRGHGTHELNFRPHNVAHIVIGTVFLWFGWFGFNAGSTLAADLRAVVAVVVTHLAACVGGLTWCLMDYRVERKWSAVGFCSGVVAGLVAITPGSGYVPVWAAIPFGILGASSANLSTRLKFILGIDDALDIFAVHGVAGFVGNMCTALFALNQVAALDGVSAGSTRDGIAGGWLSGHWIQIAYQLPGSFAGLAYSFTGSCVILAALDRIPGCRLRATDEAEVIGMDTAELGEFAYDYVALTRELLPPLPRDEDHTSDGTAVGVAFSRPSAMAPRHSQWFSGGRELLHGDDGSSPMKPMRARLGSEGHIVGRY
ncbi:hypothetical protein PpBr36_00285 [Pyricularia pennisetigena]|uniref:hypothetical protein n=1 Tax=Pyricularia pennisetigena TaxID=1578925 RepID=UPI001153F31E|nr:hypothetical protein PpBr36_00285 [Pyricularia pennisetigena]TLS28017.1 hypothetical protein PpBr36_00285 [Pyricularia pennisetigena]